MEKNDLDLNTYYKELAGRFKALSGLFDKLGSEEAVQQLLDTLDSGDAEGFSKLIKPVEIPEFPSLGKCVWLQQMIELTRKIPKVVEKCYLRDDLTQIERRQYLMIALRYFRSTPVVVTEPKPTFSTVGESPEIPPGPFLDELKANGLVTCKTIVEYEIITITGPFGKPERLCF